MNTLDITFEELVDKIEALLIEKQEAYEMDCQISAEFSPAPDYSDLIPYIESYGFDLKEFQTELESVVDQMCTPETELCPWDTTEGNILMAINDGLSDDNKQW